MSNENLTIDLDFGLSQLSGNRDLLIKMFDRFCSDYAPFADELLALAESKNTQELRMKVHTIKGVAGNLGFQALHKASKTVEDEIKQSSGQLESFLHKFIATLNETVTEIERIKNGSDPAPATNKEGLNELKRLLQENEFISSDHLNELLSNSDLSEHSKTQISQSINDLDYPAALALL